MAAPEAQFDNGVLDTLALIGTTRVSLLSMFLAIENGTHLGSAGLQLCKAKAFRLTPRARTPERPGLLSLDGEPIPFGPVEARAVPGAMRVLVPG